MGQAEVGGGNTGLEGVLRDSSVGELGKVSAEMITFLPKCLSSSWQDPSHNISPNNNQFLKMLLKVPAQIDFLICSILRIVLSSAADVIGARHSRAHTDNGAFSRLKRQKKIRGSQAVKQMQLHEQKLTLSRKLLLRSM